jgi:hypothetical protein
MLFSKTTWNSEEGIHPNLSFEIIPTGIYHVLIKKEPFFIVAKNTRRLFSSGRIPVRTEKKEEVPRWIEKNAETIITLYISDSYPHISSGS